MHILGLANGSKHGNSEILLKAALTAAQKSNPSITTSWIHVPSVSIPLNPAPLPGASDISLGTVAKRGNDEDKVIDDRLTILNAILDADALIFSTPIYSHQPAGPLKHLIDVLLGPFTDASLVTRIMEGQERGDENFAGMKVDRRILKPRVVGFMAVGGSTMQDQITMALPTLHQFVYPLHAKVVDQHVFRGFANPGAVLLDEENTIGRAGKLGENVASQIGKRYDEATYLGHEVEGACPYCHLAKVDLDVTTMNDIGCITCGARGKLVAGKDGVFRPVWEKDSDVSCITWKGKVKHVDDIFASGSAEKSRMESVKGEVERWANMEILMVGLPSNSANAKL